MYNDIQEATGKGLVVANKKFKKENAANYKRRLAGVGWAAEEELRLRVLENVTLAPILRPFTENWSD